MKYTPGARDWLIVTVFIPVPDTANDPASITRLVETMLLDRGVPVHVVAARCGHDPAMLLRVYAKRTRKADTSAASIIGELAQGVLR